MGAKQKTEIAEAQEELQLAIESLKIDYFANDEGETIGDYLLNNQEDLQNALGTNDILVENGSIIYKGVEFTVDSNGKITGSEVVEVSNKPEKEVTDDYPEWTKLNNISKTGGFDSNNKVNMPKLGSQLTAVTLTSDISEYNEDGAWYNYEAQTGTTDGKTSKWANAVTTDADGNITGFYVWIPRYAYKITSGYNQSGNEINPEDGTKGAGTIEVKFLKGTTNEFADGSGTAETNPSKITYTDDKQNEWLVHPAFSADASIGGGFGSNGGIAGIWVAKFEMSAFVDNETTVRKDLGGLSSSSTIKLNCIPEVESATGLEVEKIFDLSYNFNRKLDSHLLKNSEWGAVAYLAHSQYGRNGTEITINDFTDSDYNDYTGGSNTGKKYVNNENQTTTGNAYGIYDLSGGKYEYVANNLGLGNSNYLGTVQNARDKYENIYKFEGTYMGFAGNVLKNEKVKGDAGYETGRWFEDDYWTNFYFPTFLRGGSVTSGSNAGLFCCSCKESVSVWPRFPNMFGCYLIVWQE